MKLEYVDIFYHHRPDAETPLEETMNSLAQIVRQGKALYVGLSNYKPAEAAKAFAILKDLNIRCLIHQPRYSMFERWVEGGLLDLLEENGVGCIPFSPLAQGMLTDKYLHGIPTTSRASRENSFLKKEAITPERIDQIQKLNAIAIARAQTLAQMAIAWILKDSRITSVLIGASTKEQISDCLACQKNLPFTSEELKKIEDILL